MAYRLLAVLFLVASTVGLGHAQLLVPSEQVRDVQVTAFNFFGGSDSDGAQATDFGPFDETVSVFEPSSMVELAEASAVQVSTIRSTAVTATGSILGQRIGQETTASARSRFEVTIRIPEAVRYTLDVSLQAERDSKAMFSWVSPDFTLFLSHQANELFPSFETAMAGVLQPGIYILSGSAEDKFTALPFEESAQASYALNLQLSPVTSADCIATPNSTGAYSILTPFGQPSITENDFALRVNGVPGSVLGFFLYGQLRASTPFGAGVLCLGQPLFRFPIPASVTSNGFALESLPFDEPPFSAGPGAILPGSTWSFQFWHRDTGPAGPSWNTSDALTMTFLP